MKRVLIALAVVVTACSVDVSSNSSPVVTPSTEQAGSRSVVDGGVLLPSDTVDAAVGALLLEWTDLTQEWIALYERPAMTTVGQFVEAVISQEPIANSILDRMEATLGAIEPYLNDQLLSASDVDVAEFLEAGTTWIAGQRIQADPEFMCITAIPESASSKPVDYLAADPDYLSCFADAMQSAVIGETMEASRKVNDLYRLIYDAIVEG